MNVLDVVLLLLFIPGIIRGLKKGFLEQALALIGILFSVWAAFQFLDPVCNLLAKYVSFPEAVLRVLSFALILLAVCVLVLALAKLLTKVIEMALLGWLNKTLGVISAILVTAVLLGLLCVLFDTVNTQLELVKADSLDSSLLYGILRDFGYFIFPYLKQMVTHNPA